MRIGQRRLSRIVPRAREGFSLVTHLQENVQTQSGTVLTPDSYSVYKPQDTNILTNKITTLYRNRHTSMEGESVLFSNNTFDVMECNNKAAWSDHRTGWCHLCREPIGGSIGMHVGDRDHTNMQVSVLLSSIYPRSWKPKDLLDDIRNEAQGREKLSSNENETSNVKSKREATSGSELRSTLPMPKSTLRSQRFRQQYFSGVYAFASSTNNHDHLHVYDDALRRAELESLLLHLIDGGTMARIDSTLNKWSATPANLTVDVPELQPLEEPAASSNPAPVTSSTDAPLLLNDQGKPIPINRNSHAVLTHSVTEPNGSFPFWYSGERMWKKHMIKMITMMFPPMQAGVLTNYSQKCWGRVNQERLFDALRIQELRKAMNLPLVPENKERKAFFVRAILWELVSAKMRPSVDPVTEVLIEITIKKMCFEMIFLQTMLYMNKVQDVMASLDYIEYEDLKRLNLW